MAEELKQRSMSDKLLIDRKLLERLQERLDPHIDARDWGMLCDAFRAQQSSQGGEAVAWMNVATGCVTSLPVVVMDWDDEGEEVQSLYPHPANAPTDSLVVPVELLEMEWLEQWLLLAAEPVGQECCGRAHLECCGNAEPVYRTADEIAAAMNARREELRALLEVKP